MFKTYQHKGKKMSKTVKMRALFERAKRYYLKNDGTILHKHKEGNRDYLMSGRLFAYAVEPYNNIMDWYTDQQGFIEDCKEKGILKEGEEVEG